MRIGRQENALTAIATADATSVTVRGRDLAGDLIGRVGFTDHVWLLVTGALPSPAQRGMLDACLVAIAEHGLVPSVQAARMTLAAAPEAFQGAVAAGILGMGSVVAGSSEVAGRLLADLVAAQSEGRDWDGVARERLAGLRAEGRKVAGIGHPQHAGGDPRADRLLALADEWGLASDHVAALRALAAEAPAHYGRALPVNVSGAIAAVMLDAGWPLGALKAVPILARTAGLAAHLLEEQMRPIGFILSHHADLAIGYDGPRPGDAGTRD